MHTLHVEDVVLERMMAAAAASVVLNLKLTIIIWTFKVTEDRATHGHSFDLVLDKPELSFKSQI